MQKSARIEKFAELDGVLRCPICGSALAVREHSLRCTRGHCFDISSKGTVNLLNRQPAVHGYDAEFFESRSRILGAGFYRHVLDAVLDALSEERPHAPVLDAGCGEGYYAKAVQEGLSLPVIGLDTSAPAIQRAARGGNRVCWLVSDVANLPVLDGSLGAVLDVFTPANYNEFLRVLQPGGMLVKVVPGPRHCIELRELAGDLLRHRTHSNHRVVEHFKRHIELDAHVSATATLPVAPELARDLLGMTPILFNVDTGTLDARAVTRVTIDAELLIGRKPLP